MSRRLLLCVTAGDGRMQAKILPFTIGVVNAMRGVGVPVDVAVVDRVKPVEAARNVAYKGCPMGGALLFIDDDMIPPAPEAVVEMWGALWSAADIGMVTACSFVYKGNLDGVPAISGNVYTTAQGVYTPARVVPVNRPDYLRFISLGRAPTPGETVAGCGMAFCMISRSCMDTVARLEHVVGGPPDSPFAVQRDEQGAQVLSEDLRFSSHLPKLGLRVVAFPGVVGHVKPMDLACLDRLLTLVPPEQLPWHGKPLHDEDLEDAL